MKDYFTGVILLLENQIRIGDVIEIAGKTGTVESLTLRYVRLRDGFGYVHYVPNGVIATVTNKTLEFVYAVMDILGRQFKVSVMRICTKVYSLYWIKFLLKRLMDKRPIILFGLH